MDDSDPRAKTAAHHLAAWSREQIEETLSRYGEERFAGRIARAIVERRERGNPVRTTDELEDLVFHAYPRKMRRKSKISPATRTFQALRIAVNRELEVLENSIPGPDRPLGGRRRPGRHKLPLFGGPDRQKSFQKNPRRRRFRGDSDKKTPRSRPPGGFRRTPAQEVLK